MTRFDTSSVSAGREHRLDPGLEVLRRRRQLVAKRRRSALRPFVRPFLIALAIVGLPTASILWATQSPRFALIEITIDEIVLEQASASSAAGGPSPTASRGPRRVSDHWVRATLQPFRGSNLPRLRLATLEERLLAHPWVRSADLGKELPGRLVVRVLEKRAAALLREDDALIYLDAAGMPIAPFAPAAAGGSEENLLLVSRRTADLAPLTALELERELRVAAPTWSRALAEIEILGIGEHAVYTRALPFPLLVRAGTLGDRTPPLQRLLPQIAAQYGSLEAIDLRYNRQIIVRPARSSPRRDALDARGRNG